MTSAADVPEDGDVVEMVANLADYLAGPEAAVVGV
jgi:hypothetical protein